MILVDTSVWVDYFSGVASPPAEQLDHLLDEELILLGDLVLTEILQGFSSEQAAVAALERLRVFAFVSMIGWEIAVKAAANYRMLRRKGVTVRKTVDLWIGTFCIEHGCRLLHNDRDFQPMVDHLGLITAWSPCALVRRRVFLAANPRAPYGSAKRKASARGVIFKTVVA